MCTITSRYLKRFKLIRKDLKNENFEERFKSIESREVYLYQLNSQKRKLKKCIMRISVYLKIIRILLFTLYFVFALGIITSMNLTLLIVVSSMIIIFIHFLIFLFEKRRIIMSNKIFYINRNVYNILKLKS